MTSATQKAIGVTGASGLVGRALVRELLAAGVQVITLGRSSIAGLEHRGFELGHDLDPAIFEGLDALVHAAYDFSVSSPEEVERVNVGSSIQLFEAAKKAGLARLLFTSSISAFDGCKSNYGLGKLKVEQVVKGLGGRSVRPGLVFGDDSKGMFGTLSRLSRIPLLPVFDHGLQPLYLVHHEDLARVLVQALIRWDLPTETVPTCAHPKAIEFKDILSLLALKRGVRLRFLSVSSSLALVGLRSLEALHLPLPFRADNLMGLIHANPSPDFSYQAKTGQKLRTLQEYLT